MPLLAQSAAAAPASQTHSSDIGFTYSIPSEWEVIDSAPSVPAVQQQAAQNAPTEDTKKGLACAQIALTARHGTPPSLIVVVALPFACFGQDITEWDLPSVAQGASEGIKKSFDVSNPTYGTYALGVHGVWIERVGGTLIGHPEVKRTLETVCSILKKGVVCWMAMTSDDAALQIFEHGTVTLDGDAPAALVPLTAFDKKPPSGF
jgi:hypothetical protein